MTARRVEHDFLGEKEVPAGAYRGVPTARSLENSTASLIDARWGNVIERASQEVREGMLEHLQASTAQSFD